MTTIEPELRDFIARIAAGRCSACERPSGCDHRDARALLARLDVDPGVVAMRVAREERLRAPQADLSGQFLPTPAVVCGMPRHDGSSCDAPATIAVRYRVGERVAVYCLAHAQAEVLDGHGQYLRT